MIPPVDLIAEAMRKEYYKSELRQDNYTPWDELSTDRRRKWRNLAEVALDIIEEAAE